MKVLDGTQIEKAQNHGKFSKDRDQMAAIHQDRYIQWQMGRSFEDIAAEEGVTVNAIRNSIFRCEVKLPGTEALAIRERRQKLVTIGRLGAKCVDVLEKLLEDNNPLVRLKALDQMRKAIASEAGGGVQVNNTQVNLTNNNGGEPFDFETQLASIRRDQRAAHGRDRQVVVDITPETGGREEYDAEPSDDGA